MATKTYTLYKFQNTIWQTMDLGLWNSFQFFVILQVNTEKIMIKTNIQCFKWNINKVCMACCDIA